MTGVQTCALPIWAYPTGRPARAAQAVAAHESPRATKRYDRTSDEITLDEITLDEIEDILI